MHPGCTGKKRYTTFTEAERAAQWQSRRHDERFNAYHCQACHGFHTGEQTDHLGARRKSSQRRERNDDYA